MIKIMEFLGWEGATLEDLRNFVDVAEGHEVPSDAQVRVVRLPFLGRIIGMSLWVPKGDARTTQKAIGEDDA